MPKLVTGYQIVYSVEENAAKVRIQLDGVEAKEIMLDSPAEVAGLVAMFNAGRVFYLGKEKLFATEKVRTPFDPADPGKGANLDIA